MKNNYLLLMFAIICVAGGATAQVYPCYTDEVNKRLIAAHPELQEAKADYERQISNALKKIDLGKASRTTSVDQSGNESFWYDIPVVVHLIHDYGTEDLNDDAIFNDLIDWNIVYAKQNGDTSTVIELYNGFIPGTNVRYMGNVHMRLHLATKDPNGNPTKGITRRRSYLTYIGGDQSKLDDWPPTSYVNIWAVNQMDAANGNAAAYAYQPAPGAEFPYYDGIICLYNYVANDYTGASTGGISKTINHEMGHVFSLYHPWGDSNTPGSLGCNGTDGVDDTPPTLGHNPSGCVNSALYDTTCAGNNFVVYTKVTGGDSLVNYPDTVNAQNIMDYTYCARMFTAGQVARMHAALNNATAGRSNLWDTGNLQLTGVMDADHNFINRPDLKPIPDFAISKSLSGSPATYMNRVNYFTFPGTSVTFYNETTNDTVTAMTWTFSNNATTPVSSATTSFFNSFATPGWVSLTMTATGNNTGDSTVTWPRALFVANTTGTPGANIDQEFSGADTVNWPMFNYYNNEFKWQMANVGTYDNNSLEYIGFDSRLNPSIGVYPITGTPTGDFDDFFTIPVDLSAYTAGHCSLNFNYSGASRTSNSLYITDTLMIDYTINNGATWSHVAILSKGTLNNKGVVSTSYTPSSPDDWAQMSLDIPAAAITNYTTFRFRYRPGVGAADPSGNTYSTGNNFYMDGIHFKPYPASVANIDVVNADILVVPNPTSGDAFVYIKDVDNTIARIIVTDVTGKVVFTTSQQVTGKEAQIEIPGSVISVKGIYIVQATTGTKTNTQKLVVY